jgi:hypothetical protein
MPRTHIAARVRGWRALAALIGAASIVTAAAAGSAAAAPSQAADRAALQALAPPSLFTWGMRRWATSVTGSSVQTNSRKASASLR